MKIGFYHPIQGVELDIPDSYAEEARKKVLEISTDIAKRNEKETSWAVRRSLELVQDLCLVRTEDGEPFVLQRRQKFNEGDIPVSPCDTDGLTKVVILRQGEEPQEVEIKDLVHGHMHEKIADLFEKSIDEPEPEPKESNDPADNSIESDNKNELEDLSSSPYFDDDYMEDEE